MTVFTNVGLFYFGIDQGADQIFFYDPINQITPEWKVQGDGHMGAIVDIGAFFLWCVRAITSKETQLGTSKQSKLINGRICPFEVTYVRSRNKVYPPSDREPRTITWHHSWRVSGCWVKIKGIGKDREGKRVVKGMTWRIPHVKGTGPLVEKIRVVLPEKVLPPESGSDNGV